METKEKKNLKGASGFGNKVSTATLLKLLLV